MGQSADIEKDGENEAAPAVPNIEVGTMTLTLRLPFAVESCE
jgi:hypothetical protein